ncbi:hypothetical protein EET67_22480 [Pseudaminobacter arsenicus]|uniref:Uncharacterized protein n=1 Tax=Borborobacter arsenicus TaxID=1851146 RepID=A0A432V093_9HYPH|nr:hypothetical protein [Pseudaminobacter arsenicus]RUM95599.1 hypothetical protein EET67_22480 [Pseudaminobacter arsenicus]
MRTNDATRATAEAMPTKATVPYPGQEPVDEIDQAIAQLRSLRLAMLADSQGLSNFTTSDAELIICDVLDQLDPIRTFLAENEFDDVRMAFVECRRIWARKGGAA